MQRLTGERKGAVCAAALLGACLGLHNAMAQNAVAQQAADSSAVITVEHGPNAPEQLRKHYVILVSLDGFRYDYAKKYGAKHLLAMAAHGASAPDGMIPSYPSITFPNHYTIVTGLYPEHHGIVGMTFYNADHTKEYRYSDPKSNGDGSWYSGTPLWVLAEQQGMRSACFFWPGAEAAIQGVRPSFYLHFNDKFPDEQRVDQVLGWLKLPAAQRPHFITLYYSNVDHAGHEFGPDSPETRAAVAHVDAMIGLLQEGIAASQLPIDLVVVSDHGMEKEQGTWINLDQYADLSHFVTAGSFLYPDSEAAAEQAYQKLKAADARFMVYRRANVPAYLEYNDNAREGDPVIVPRGPYAIRAHAPPAGTEDHPPNVGSHGFDPREMPSMKAIFYAQGPDVRPGTEVKPFENVNVYPFVAQMLELKTPPIDGSVNVLAGALTDAAQPVTPDLLPKKK